MSTDFRDPGHRAPMIPGAYERNTLTHRQLGSIGAASVGVPQGAGRMDAATIADREREGGGAPNQRPRAAQVQAVAPALTPGASASKGSWFTGGYLWFSKMRLARR